MAISAGNCASRTARAICSSSIPPLQSYRLAACSLYTFVLYPSNNKGSTHKAVRFPMTFLRRGSHSDTPPVAVVAIGGNSLITDNKDPSVPKQWDAVRETTRNVANMVEAGWTVIVTHGNGPQVGFILRRNELAAAEVHP